MHNNQPVPVTIRGVTYPSKRAAARALGMHHATIGHAVKRGTLDLVGLGTGAPIPVRIRKKLYPSVKDAAKALKVTPSTVSTALRNGTADNVGHGRGKDKRDPSKNGREKPITVAGQTFRSASAMSLFCGYHRRWASTHIQRRGLEASMPIFVQEVMRATLAQSVTQQQRKP